MKINYNPAIISVFLWTGFVCAISFMEAWLKFRAPCITVPLGLGIGRLVFSALNKMELLFAFIITVTLIFNRQTSYWLKKWYHMLPLATLLFHTFYLLPALDARAEFIISGKKVPQSNLHFIYIGTELVKVIALFILGLRLLNYRNQYNQ